jgi:hypothetical protein
MKTQTLFFISNMIALSMSANCAAGSGSATVSGVCAVCEAGTWNNSDDTADN